MRRLLTALALLAAPAARADECHPSCAELHEMEYQLFAQEYLQEKFQHFVDGAVPSPGMMDDPDHPGQKTPENLVEALQRQAAQDLSEHLGGPAGGARRQGRARRRDRPRLQDPPVPAQRQDRPLRRQGLPQEPTRAGTRTSSSRTRASTWPTARPGIKLFDTYSAYAAGDVRAYGVGIRNLRASIAETASRCGWKGSTRKGAPSPTKPNPVDKKDEPVVPTPQEVKDLVSQLQNAPTAARGAKK